jgi:hypothetical protein
MAEFIKTKSGSNRTRSERAILERFFDSLRNQPIIETRAEHFLRVLQAGSVSTNNYLRRFHTFALDMGWLPWPVLPKRQWPVIHHQEKHAITREEHEKIIAAETNAEMRAFLKKHCSPTVTLEVKSGHGAKAYMVSPRSADAQAALRALRQAFGYEPVLLREGGSIPIVNQFKRILGADTLLLGLALPDDNAHSPNEKFDLDVFAKGQQMSARLWQELARR